MCVQLSFCVYHIHVNAHINQKILDPLKLNLQAVVSLLMGVADSKTTGPLQQSQVHLNIVPFLQPYL